MMNIKFKTIKKVVNNIQSLKSKMNLKSILRFGKYHDQMKYRRQIGNFQFEVDPFSKTAQGRAFIRHEALL